MNDRSSPLDRRLDRRIPLGCTAAILLPNGESVPAECIEIGVGGMTIHAAYVPGESETLKVMVMSPGEQVDRPPLVTHLEVKRCHALGNGLYEIGGATVLVVE